MIAQLVRLTRWEWYKLRSWKPHSCRPLRHAIPLCTSTRILSVEFAVTHPDSPIRTKLLGLRSSQDHPQFKDSTVYRQVRPTRLDEIKNLHLEVQAGGVETAQQQVC